MRRRTYLTALAAGVSQTSGCVQAVRERYSEPRHWRFDAWVDAQPTTGSPGRIAVELTNESGVAASPVFGAVPPFSRLVSSPADSGDRLALLPVEDTDAITPSVDDLLPRNAPDRCWRLRRGFSLGEPVGDVRVEPGESVGARFHVSYRSEPERCSAGRYVFENETRDFQYNVGLRYGLACVVDAASTLSVEPTAVTVVDETE